MKNVTEFGHKNINQENWIEPDEAGLLLGQVTVDGFRNHSDAVLFLNHVLSLELKKEVPREIRGIFEVTRGTLTYGYYYYPIFTAAYEQLFRIHELAATKALGRITGKEVKNSFYETILNLKDLGIIKKEDYELWQAIRKVRNLFSHPKAQSIETPGNVVSKFKSSVDRINLLFESVMKYEDAKPNKSMVSTPEASLLP